MKQLKKQETELKKECDKVLESEIKNLELQVKRQELQNKLKKLQEKNITIIFEPILPFLPKKEKDRINEIVKGKLKENKPSFFGSLLNKN